jgi:CelD/BcsL family acetyltransferase involved in cellulose biosynthesis
MTQSGQTTSKVLPSQLDMEVIREPGRWATMAEQWRALSAVSPSACPTLDYYWLRTWWDVYGGVYSQAEDGLRIVTCRRGGRLVAALPLYDRRPARAWNGGRRLGFIGTGESEREEICSDYLDLLYRPEDREEATAGVWKLLVVALAGEYDFLELTDVSDTSPLVQWARGDGARRHAEVSPRGACPIADLSGGFEAYLGRLSANTRQQCRRLMRQADEAKVVFEVANESTRDEFFEQLVELHQRRWQGDGKPGCFSAERFARFHRELIMKWLPEGRAVLSRLSLAGRPIAVKYGFVLNGKYDFYQSGVLADDAAVLKSPGVVSFMYLMRHLAGQGVKTFDFLRGSSSYKQRLATTAQPLVQVRVVRGTWRSGATRLYCAARRVGGKARRMLQQRTGVASAEASGSGPQ